MSLAPRRRAYSCCGEERQLLGQGQQRGAFGEGGAAAPELLAGGLGAEDDVQAHHVAVGPIVFGAVDTAAAHAHLEGAEALDVDLVAVLQLVAHGVGQLAEHGQDVGALHGAVVLHALGQLPQRGGLGVVGSCVPPFVAQRGALVVVQSHFVE